MSGSPPRVAIQGEPGAFSEEAAQALLGDGIEIVPLPTLAAAFGAAESGAADYLVVPIENSLAGEVPGCRALWEASELRIRAQTTLPITQNLIAAPGATLDEITTVASHPVALAQCRLFLAQHPHWRILEAPDTAGSVRALMQRDTGREAAIASRQAAALYGAAILSPGIQDDPSNQTRFLLLSRP